jgi:hypothetical protein
MFFVTTTRPISTPVMPAAAPESHSAGLFWMDSFPGEQPAWSRNRQDFTAMTSLNAGTVSSIMSHPYD